MKTKYKVMTYAALPILGLGLLGVGTALASGGFGFMNSNLTPVQIAQNQQTMFQNEANLLGISIDDVKSGWAAGKTLSQIAADHGITQTQLTQKIKDAQLANLKTQLQGLVSQGVITQVQADQRLAYMQTRVTKGKGHHGVAGMGMLGF